MLCGGVKGPKMQTDTKSLKYLSDLSEALCAPGSHAVQGESATLLDSCCKGH